MVQTPEYAETRLRLGMIEMLLIVCSVVDSPLLSPIVCVKFVGKNRHKEKYITRKF